LLFDVLTVVLTNIAIFWDKAPCSHLRYIPADGIFRVFSVIGFRRKGFVSVAIVRL
jgi:hypothetical protein